MFSFVFVFVFNSLSPLRTTYAFLDIWAAQLPEHGQSLMGHVPEENSLSLPRSHQLPITSQLRVGLPEPPTHMLGFGLARSWAKVLCMQSQYLWLIVQTQYHVSKYCFSMGIHFLWLLEVLSTSCFGMALSLRGCDTDLPDTTQSLILWRISPYKLNNFI